MIYHPSWRTENPEKFCGELTKYGSKSKFVAATNTFPLKNNPAWRDCPLIDEGQTPEVYIEGLEKLGNDLSLRTRNKDAEYDPAT
jgi:hypothetical protein